MENKRVSRDTFRGRQQEGSFITKVPKRVKKNTKGKGKRPYGSQVWQVAVFLLDMKGGLEVSMAGKKRDAVRN